MDEDTKRRLAAAIVKDVEQLTQRAAVQGVTAYLGRATQRERPNERFLVHTLRSVQQSNKRAEEDEMWQRRRKQLRSEAEQEREARRSRQARRRSRSRSREGERSSQKRRRRGRSEGSSSREGEEGREGEEAGEPTSPGGGGGAAEGQQGSDSEDAVFVMLAGKRTRGRGGIGSRMDLAGPCMEAMPAGGGGGSPLPPNEDTAVFVRRMQQVGPPRPDWLQPADVAAGAQQHQQPDGSCSDSGDSSRERRRLERKRHKEKKRKHKKRQKEESKAHKKKSSRKQRSRSRSSDSEGS